MHAGIKCQIEFGKIFFRLSPRFDERYFFAAGQANLFSEVEQIEIDLKDWRATQITNRPHLFNDFFERQVLIRQRIEYRYSDAREHVAKTWIARQVRSQREIIQEESDQRFALN